jgi:hypothetical protein
VKPQTDDDDMMYGRNTHITISSKKKVFEIKHCLVRPTSLADRRTDAREIVVSVFVFNFSILPGEEVYCSILLKINSFMSFLHRIVQLHILSQISNVFSVVLFLSSLRAIQPFCVIKCFVRTHKTMHLFRITAARIISRASQLLYKLGFGLCVSV